MEREEPAITLPGATSDSHNRRQKVNGLLISMTRAAQGSLARHQPYSLYAFKPYV